MALSLGELAAIVGGRIEGDAARLVERVSSLQASGPDAITYYRDPKLEDFLAETHAAAVVLCRDDAPFFAGNRIIVSNPALAFAKIAAALHPRPEIEPGIHSTAVVHQYAEIAAGAQIGPMVVVENGAHVGAGVVVGAQCYIGAGAEIGTGTRLDAQVTISHNCMIGNNCVISPGVVIGAAGFGYVPENSQWLAVPQLGRVVIGDDVEIGANTTIDRGALDDTIIGNGVKLDNQIQIAHNVQIGEHSIFAGCVGVAGSAKIGKRCRFGGRVSILGHLEIVDNVEVTATSVVTRSLLRAGRYSSCVPVQDNRVWRKNAARIHNLDALAQRLKALEARLNQ